MCVPLLELLVVLSLLDQVEDLKFRNQHISKTVSM